MGKMDSGLMALVRGFGGRPARRKVSRRLPTPGVREQCLALEPRIMLDAAGAASGTEAADTPDKQNKDGDGGTDGDSADAKAREAAQKPGLDPAVKKAVDALKDGAPAQRERQEVAVVDESVEDSESLVNALPDDTRVVRLDGDGNGVREMADAVAGMEDIDGLHVLSHGATAEVTLGNTTLDSQSLDAHENALTTIGDSMADGGDLMLYGCYTGAGGAGHGFVQDVAAVTGADVAASTDDTGAVAQGGDWDLEKATGTIETDSLAAEGYAGVLKTATFSFDGKWGSKSYSHSVDTGSKIKFANGEDNGFGGPGDGVDKQDNVDITVDGLHNQSLRNWTIYLDNNGSGGTPGPGSTTGHHEVIGNGDKDFSTSFTADGEYTDIYIVIGSYNVNEAPTTDGGSTTIDEGKNGSVTLTDNNTNSSDPDGDSLDYDPSSISYDINDPSKKGTETYSTTSYTVSDGNGGTASDTFTIYGDYEDDPTSWGGASDTTWNSGGSQSYDWSTGADDPDDSVDYVVESGTPDWMNDGETITGNPGVSNAGESPTIDVYAEGTDRIDDSFTINVSGGDDLNDAPSASNNTRTVDEDGSVSFSAGDFNFSDPDAGNQYNSLDHVTVETLPGEGTLKLDGSDVSTGDTIAQSALSKLTYQPAANYNGSDSFDFKVSDGLADSGIATMNLTVDQMNDAPTLTSSNPALSGITEDDTANTGDAVSTLNLGSDVDRNNGTASHGSNHGEKQGIAVHGLSNNGPADSGHWEYDTGGGWTDVGSVSESNALLLTKNDDIRFVPDTHNGTEATVDYYAWDQSSGSAGNKVDASTRGGSDATAAFSATGDTATISVSDVNDAPTISDAPSDQTVDEDDTLTIAGPDFDDVDITDRSDGDSSNNTVEVTLTSDHGAQTLTTTSGIIVTSGTNGSSKSLTFQGALSDVNTALDSWAYSPDPDWNSEDAFVSSTGDDTLDVTVDDLGNVGGSSKSASTSFDITVDPVNDAPELAADQPPRIPGIAEDTESPDGVAINDMLQDGSIIDPDPESIKAVAVTGVDNNNGTWEYSTNDGTEWQTVSDSTGDVNLAANALLLDGTKTGDNTNKLRFVPDTNWNGEADLEFRLWDKSEGTRDAGEAVDLSADSAHGDPQAFGGTVNTLTIDVANVNDTPVVATSPSDQDFLNEGTFSYTLPEGTFHDIDTDPTLNAAPDPELTLSASGLPRGLSFDPESRTFTNKRAGPTGTFSVTVTATDTAGATASTAFSIGRDGAPPPKEDSDDDGGIGDDGGDTTAGGDTGGDTGGLISTGDGLGGGDTGGSGTGGGGGTATGGGTTAGGGGLGDPFADVDTGGGTGGGTGTTGTTTGTGAGSGGTGGDTGATGPTTGTETDTGGTGGGTGTMNTTTGAGAGSGSTDGDTGTTGDAAGDGVTDAAGGGDTGTTGDAAGDGATDAAGGGDTGTTGNTAGDGATDAAGGADGQDGATDGEGATSDDAGGGTGGDGGTPAATAQAGGQSDGLVVSEDVPDATVSSGQAAEVSVPETTFTKPDGTPAEDVEYQGEQPDGDPLPEWANVDRNTGAIEANPPEDFQGTIDVRVTARDGDGNVASTTVTIDVAPDNPDAATDTDGGAADDGGGAGDSEAADGGDGEREARRDPLPAPPGREGLSAQLTRAGRAGAEQERLALLASLEGFPAFGFGQPEA